MLHLHNLDLQTNFSMKYVQKTSLAEINYSDRNIVPRVEKVILFLFGLDLYESTLFTKHTRPLFIPLQYLKKFMQSSRNRRFLDKEFIINDLRAEYSDYSRKPWGVVSNLVSRGGYFLSFNNVFNSVFVYTVFLPIALVVLDELKTNKTLGGESSDGSTIDIMSSGDEDIDITNDLDTPESETQYVIDVNSSEFAQKYVFQLNL